MIATKSLDAIFLYDIIKRSIGSTIRVGNGNSGVLIFDFLNLGIYFTSNLFRMIMKQRWKWINSYIKVLSRRDI